MRALLNELVLGVGEVAGAGVMLAARAAFMVANGAARASRAASLAQLVTQRAAGRAAIVVIDLGQAADKAGHAVSGAACSVGQGAMLAARAAGAARLLIVGATARASAVVLEVDPLAELGGLLDRCRSACGAAAFRPQPANVAPSTVDAPGPATNKRSG